MLPFPPKSMLIPTFAADGSVLAASGHVLCFGEVLLRLSTSGYRLMIQSDSFDVVVGGAEADVATGLASPGHPVKMLTRLPSGPLGDKAPAAMAAAGVDVSLVGRACGRMGLYFLESGGGLGPHRSRSCWQRVRLLPDTLNLTSALEGARLLHLPGITHRPGWRLRGRSSPHVARAREPREDGTDLPRLGRSQVQPAWRCMSAGRCRTGVILS